MRKYKGRIKWNTLKKMLSAREYKGHTIENGMYIIDMQKTQFEVVPISVKFLSVYQTGW